MPWKLCRIWQMVGPYSYTGDKGLNVCVSWRLMDLEQIQLAPRQAHCSNCIWPETPVMLFRHRSKSTAASPEAARNQGQTFPLPAYVGSSQIGTKQVSQPSASPQSCWLKLVKILQLLHHEMLTEVAII